MIRKVEIAGVNTAKLPVLSNEEKTRIIKESKRWRFRGKGKIYTR